MAFTPTVLQEAILRTSEVNGFGYKENETRPSRYGALEAFAEQVSGLVPASTLKAIKESSEQATSIDVFQREATGTGTARKCSGTGTGTTVNIPVTFATYAEEFQLSYLEHAGNRTKYAEAFNHLFNERIKSLLVRLDTDSVTYLEANKTTANAGTIITQVANAGQVLKADKDQFFNKIKAEMEQNDYYSGIINVASTTQRELIRFDQAQGGANATNLEFQMGDFMHKTTNRITNGLGVQSTSYMVAPGTIGAISWTNQLARDGKDIGTDQWSTFADPSGLIGDIELKVKLECADNGAGKEADYVESFVMAVEVAFISAYDSVLGAPIFKYEEMSA